MRARNFRRTRNFPRRMCTSWASRSSARVFQVTRRMPKPIVPTVLSDVTTVRNPSVDKETVHLRKVCRPRVLREKCCPHNRTSAVLADSVKARFAAMPSRCQVRNATPVLHVPATINKPRNAWHTRRIAV